MGLLRFRPGNAPRLTLNDGWLVWTDGNGRRKLELPISDVRAVHLGRDSGRGARIVTLRGEFPLRRNVKGLPVLVHTIRTGIAPTGGSEHILPELEISPIKSFGYCMTVVMTLVLFIASGFSSWPNLATFGLPGLVLVVGLVYWSRQKIVFHTDRILVSPAWDRDGFEAKTRDILAVIELPGETDELLVSTTKGEFCIAADHVGYSRAFEALRPWM